MSWKTWNCPLAKRNGYLYTLQMNFHRMPSRMLLLLTTVNFPWQCKWIVLINGGRSNTNIMRLFGLKISSRHDISQLFPHLLRLLRVKRNELKIFFSLNKTHKVSGILHKKTTKQKTAQQYQQHFNILKSQSLPIHRPRSKPETQPFWVFSIAWKVRHWTGSLAPSAEWNGISFDRKHNFMKYV